MASGVPFLGVEGKDTKRGEIKIHANSQSEDVELELSQPPGGPMVLNGVSNT